ncbi:MAG: DUF2254 domain-containing protein [Clostridiaceae bacterium]|nr:DUF2254 domain-containing protein [Clostridiaceae bacterium]
MLQKLLMQIQKKIWITPMIYSLIALALAIFIILLDSRAIGDIKKILPDYLFTDIDLAKLILSTIAASLLTMMTFTFSTIMVVLTMYSSQFSPRTLPNFLTDKKSITVLGVFIGSFIYVICSLFFMRQSLSEHKVISATIGVLLAIVSLAFFIFFIYHISTSIQVSSLIKRLSHESMDLIDNYKKLIERNNLHLISNWQSEEDSKTIEVTASKDGYIQMIDYDRLIKDALEENIIIDVRVNIGSFVIEDEEIAILYIKKISDVETIEKIISNRFTIGSEKSVLQNIRFSIEKLVDIGLRAISPGINDPNTANECIGTIGVILGEITSCTSEKIIAKDKDENVLAIFYGIDFHTVLYSVFYQLRHYGRQDISVMLSIMDALIMTAYKSSEQNKKILWDFHKYVIENDGNINFKGLDKDYLQRKINKLKDVCEIYN